MTVTINGSTGIASVDGSAASPSVKGSDSNSGIVYAADTVALSTAGSERMRVDSSGNVGIGTTATGLGSYSTLHIKGPSGEGAALRLQDNSDTADSNDAAIYKNANALYLRVNGTDPIVAYQNGAERARVTSAGAVLIGKDTTSQTTGQGLVIQANANISYAGNGSGDHDFAEFYRGTSGSYSRVGYIRTNGSSTTYSTSSDYRLKENEVAISDGITRLKTLKPYKFNFKVDPDTKVDGFFAHEVTPAVPEAVTGEKDGTEMQGIDQSKLVPLLTAALQEAITEIETLKTKVAALEAAS